MYSTEMFDVYMRTLCTIILDWHCTKYAPELSWGMYYLNLLKSNQQPMTLKLDSSSKST